MMEKLPALSKKEQNFRNQLKHFTALTKTGSQVL